MPQVQDPVRWVEMSAMLRLGSQSDTSPLSTVIFHGISELLVLYLYPEMMSFC